MSVKSEVKSVTFRRQSASLVLHYEEDGGAKISNLYSQERGKGHARELMNAVLEQTDREGLVVWLEVQRFGNPRDGLDNFQLMDFYQSFGFVPKPEDYKPPRWMERQPLLKGES